MQKVLLMLDVRRRPSPAGLDLCEDLVGQVVADPADGDGSVLLDVAGGDRNGVSHHGKFTWGVFG